MKIFNKTLLASFLALTVSASSFASCYENYQEKKSEAEEIIANSNHKQVMIEAGALSISSNIVVLSALAGSGGALVSTTAGAGLVSSLLIADKYIELRLDDSAKDAFLKKALLEASLTLLKEAYIGQGPHLSQALTILNQNVSTSISLKNLADTIVSQDKARFYCHNDQIMSPSGIISLATEKFKADF